MSLRTCSTVLVLLAAAFAAPASAQERVPAPQREHHQRFERERLRARILDHVQERKELQRELRRRLREDRQELLDRLAERLRERHERRHRERLEHPDRRRWRGREGWHGFLRQCPHSRNRSVQVG